MKSNLIIIIISVLFSCQKKQDATPVTLDKSKLLQLVNDLRQKGCTCGTTVMPIVPKVALNDLLNKAAQDHSNDMDKNNYFSHTSQDGRDPGKRITSVGYNWGIYGENILIGYPDDDEESVIKRWKDSEGHCKNIMNGTVTEMGMGKSGEYWTQIFAKR